MRWLLRGALATLVLALIVAVLLVKQVVFPTLQQPGPTDVIVVLGPYFSTQEAEAKAVLALAPQAEVLDSWVASSGCPQLSVHEMCFKPSPFTTEGEARFGAAWARAHGARSITVVAPEYQASRARLWFGRCWSGRLAVVSAHTTVSQRVHMIGYQVAATVKAEVFERRC